MGRGAKTDRSTGSPGVRPLPITGTEMDFPSSRACNILCFWGFLSTDLDVHVEAGLVGEGPVAAATHEHLNMDVSLIKARRTRDIWCCLYIWVRRVSLPERHRCHYLFRPSGDSPCFCFKKAQKAPPPVAHIRHGDLRSNAHRRRFRTDLSSFLVEMEILKSPRPSPLTEPFHTDWQS